MFGRQKMDTSDDGVFKDYGNRKYRRPYMRRKRRKPTVYQVNKKVNRIYRKLQKDVDLKHFTVAVSLGTLVTGTPQYNSLVSAIQQGDTDSTRNGDKIKIQSLQWKLRLSVGATESNGACSRIMFIYDRNPQGAQATMANVLNNTTCQGLMNLNTQYLGRFQVLYDDVFNLDPDTNQFRFTKGYRKLNLPVWYNGNTGAIADLQRGNLFCLVLTENNSVNMNLSGQIRIRFTDLS